MNISKRMGLLGLASFAIPLEAQELATGEATPALDTIVVIGSRPSDTAHGLAGSIDVIGRDELEYEHVDDTMELFTKVPGTYLSRFNQGIINTDVAIRGFAGDGNSPHVKLLIDGIPSNLHSGYPEMDQLFPLGIEAVEVFKGTSDARYGVYNIAGNYSLSSRADTAVSSVEATLGSFDTRELQAYAGLDAAGLGQNYFAGYRAAQGYRDHTSLEKRVASASWRRTIGEDAAVRLVTRYAGYEGDAPGYLSREVARQDPTSSADYASQDGGEKETVHASLHLDTPLGAALDLSLKGYWQRFERERWVRFSQTASLQNRFDDEDQRGVRASLDWRLPDGWTVSVGADHELQHNVEQRFGTTGQLRRRDSANVIRNNHFDFSSSGAFVQIDHRPNAVVSWNAALRLDRLGGDLTRVSADGTRTPLRMFDFGTIVQPKLNLLVAASDALTLFANLGRSFQHPFGASAYTTGPTRARDVSINDGGEIGFTWRPQPAANVRLSWWAQDASDEFVSIDGVPRNVGKTERSGIDLSLSWAIDGKVDLWANYTRIASEIVTPDDSQSAWAGNELRSIPGYTASLGAAWTVVPDFVLRAHVDGQGDYFVNEANLGGSFGGYTLAGISATYQWRRWRFGLQVNNLFDDYHEYVFDFSTDGSDTIHSPGDGRSVSFSVGCRF
jgi:iron complex outermembrane recepter protein